MFPLSPCKSIIIPVKCTVCVLSFEINLWWLGVKYFCLSGKDKYLTNYLQKGKRLAINGGKKAVQPSQPDC
ncbi:hypothetical protein D1164_10025 [Mariniphaga sediminis]|uniref:Uncharacterized protein n=1 Tax=Mariniphaga sediminis TaxID=1628158 RepID=A0A399D401_9BACT|nr:hypothetical protein D1164_10025 [Mariniphaga sediminis]